MTNKAFPRSDWTADEVDLIVADYFEMLSLELAGKPYVKAHRNAALQKMIDRPHAAIEFKHCNISAVLELLGLPTIAGYKPRRNYQKALVAGVDRYLERHEDPIDYMRSSVIGVSESAAIWIEAPPQMSEDPIMDAPESLRHLVRKFDPAARDARNRTLGKKGEELFLHHERQRLVLAGRNDLADDVCWVSDVEGDGAGYDIRSFETNGSERLIEVKTTNGHAKTPFFLSENERTFSEVRPDAFRLMRLYNFARQPAAFEIQPPLDNWVKLNPVSYRATF